MAQFYAELSVDRMRDERSSVNDRISSSSLIASTACIKSSTEGDKYLDLITYFYDDAYDYEYYEYNVLYSLMLNMRKDIHI